ncbi:hypothetical protein CRUP_023573 [Coryphaenoides rupestris]|nr:hypothetical protein CRUP_023573 [Coryphaenoides rupestris]
MPFNQRTVEPRRLSRLPARGRGQGEDDGCWGAVAVAADGRRYRKPVLFSSLDEVSCHTMVNLIHQLSDLSRHAGDLFVRIEVEAGSVLRRCRRIQGRLDTLHNQVRNFEPKKVQIPLKRRRCGEYVGWEAIVGHLRSRQCASSWVVFQGGGVSSRVVFQAGGVSSRVVFQGGGVSSQPATAWFRWDPRQCASSWVVFQGGGVSSRVVFQAGGVSSRVVFQGGGVSSQPGEAGPGPGPGPGLGPGPEEMRGDGGDKPAAVGLTRALSWLNVSTLSRQTRRLFRSQSELRANGHVHAHTHGRRDSRSQSRSHTHLHAVGAGGRGHGDSDDDDDNWVYEPQHRTDDKLVVCLTPPMMVGIVSASAPDKEGPRGITPPPPKLYLLWFCNMDVPKRLLTIVAV